MLIRCEAWEQQKTQFACGHKVKTLAIRDFWHDTLSPVTAEWLKSRPSRLARLSPRNGRQIPPAFHRETGSGR